MPRNINWLYKAVNRGTSLLLILQWLYIGASTYLFIKWSIALAQFEGQQLNYPATIVWVIWRIVIFLALPIAAVYVWRGVYTDTGMARVQRGSVWIVATTNLSAFIYYTYKLLFGQKFEAIDILLELIIISSTFTISFVCTLLLRKTSNVQHNHTITRDNLQQ